ncbi:hypothetical protein PR202_gb02069 [Eleusine coracana subsp. coracana]|uniref:Uncharacterized protein n=1 Tax=Eleusine coracana subsp. coracana TaxID=191504 RepID=A0AAV5DZ70_ELECO|nr:hypothetical protein PR202_gb02069 [Eleusine coracana subsp. coracana]
MEIIPYPDKSGAPNPREDGNRTGEPVVPVATINSSLSNGDDVLRSYNDPRYYEKMHRYSLSVWLENMEYTKDDVPEMPPVFVVQYPDLVEKAWGWQRSVPFLPAFVGWSAYKAYLEKYSRENYGEVAALCANNKPDKDKSYFVCCADKKPYPNGQVTASNCDALQANVQPSW